GGGVLTAVALWATIGLGMLDKGLLAVVLPAGIIAATEAGEGVLRPRTLIARLRALHAPVGIAVLTVLAGPWHALAALRNPGFLWDYVVNQHVLFFFDQKLPRDSLPDSLGFFLAMFPARGLPWSLLLPAAGVWTYRTARDDPARAPAVGLLAAWVAVVVGFFALAPSRLEHYSLPALPATALLVGALLVDARSRVSVGWLVGPLGAGAALALGVLLLPPGRLIAWIEPTFTGLGLDALVRPTGLLLAAVRRARVLPPAAARSSRPPGVGASDVPRRARGAAVHVSGGGRADLARGRGLLGERRRGAARGGGEARSRSARAGGSRRKPRAPASAVVTRPIAGDDATMRAPPTRPRAAGVPRPI